VSIKVTKIAEVVPECCFCPTHIHLQLLFILSLDQRRCCSDKKKKPIAEIGSLWTILLRHIEMLTDFGPGNPVFQAIPGHPFPVVKAHFDCHLQNA
jgi:hypothetical protein